MPWKKKKRTKAKKPDEEVEHKVQKMLQEKEEEVKAKEEEREMRKWEAIERERLFIKAFYSEYVLHSDQ